MEKNYFSYVNEITEGNLESLYQLISLQYKKFVRFYSLVKDYSSLITKVKYEFNSPSSLDVVLYFQTTKKLATIKKEFDDKIANSDYSGTIEVGKNKLSMSIVLDE